jgi:hypothetical protein
VRHLVGHVVGAMRSAASNREMVSQLREINRRVRRDGGAITDTMTQVQIDRTAALDREALVRECRSLVDPRRGVDAGRRHRIDLCCAIGATPMLTAEHDGRIIADVAAEWARRHGQPCHLELTGPAGGTFRFGTTSPDDHLELDAVDFCRILSGRAPGDGLLATPVPF